MDKMDEFLAAQDGVRKISHRTVHPVRLVRSLGQGSEETDVVASADYQLFRSRSVHPHQSCRLCIAAIRRTRTSARPLHTSHMVVFPVSMSSLVFADGAPDPSLLSAACFAVHAYLIEATRFGSERSWGFRSTRVTNTAQRRALSHN